MAPISWHFSTVVFDYGQLSSSFLCLLFAVIYVGSLYVHVPVSHGRDHPDTIKFRFLRVGFVCLLILPLLWSCSTRSYSVKSQILFTWIGIRANGFVAAAVLPFVLTMVLFLGPLSLHYLDGVFKIYAEPRYWVHNYKNLIWLRNHVVAPASEEFIFRACMLPLLVPSFGEVNAMLICPLFFGVAHFHHMWEKISAGTAWKVAAAQAVFQFFYTTLFGAYSAFVFLRTGHLIAPIVVHGFCNHMGFPDFNQVFAHSNPKRFYISAAFVIGLLCWVWLLYPLTEPWLYQNELYDI